ncbi:MAG: phosphate signaling complex protein PhoU [Acutalibacteraceae bacterium]
MRSKFDEQLELLHHNMIAMGGLCENAIAMSAQALTKNDIVLAGKVPGLSADIDQKEREIEAMCMKLLLQQQPVAKDLRIISSALKMITDMERIGDNSGDIAEIVSMGNINGEHDTLNIRDMALATIKMVTESIDAFVKRDTELARSVINYDDVVDNYFNEIKKSLIEQLKSHDYSGEATLDLLMIAKYFERIGDHAVNIAKWVLLSITGKKE